MKTLLIAMLLGAALALLLHAYPLVPSGPRPICVEDHTEYLLMPNYDGTFWFAPNWVCDRWEQPIVELDNSSNSTGEVR